MKKYLSFTLTIFLVTAALSIAAPDKDTLMANEKAAWQAFKDKKADDFKKVVSADLVAVYAEGMMDMANELSDMKKWDMKSFTFSDFKVTAVGSDIAITTYKVALQGTYDGKDASGTYNAGSVWKMENGGWMGIFHTNIKQAAGAK